MAIFGADNRESGEILDGQPAGYNPDSAGCNSELAFGYLPEDRKLQGLFLKMADPLNVSAADLGDISRSGFLKLRQRT